MGPNNQKCHKYFDLPVWPTPLSITKSHKQHFTVATSSFFSSIFPLSRTFTCRWHTLHGCSQGRQFSGAAQKLTVRPLYERGKDSISQQTCHPGTQSAQYSGPAAHERELIVWPKTTLLPLPSLFLQFCFFLLLCLSLLPPSLPSSLRLCPNYPTLCPQPTYCLVIRTN